MIHGSSCDVIRPNGWFRQPDTWKSFVGPDVVEFEVVFEIVAVLSNAAGATELSLANDAEHGRAERGRGNGISGSWYCTNA